MSLLPLTTSSKVQLGGEGRCNGCVVGGTSTEYSINRTGPGRSSILYSQSLALNEIFINKLKFSWQARSCNTTKSCQPQLSDSEEAGHYHSLFTKRSSEKFCSTIPLSLRINEVPQVLLEASAVLTAAQRPQQATSTRPSTQRHKPPGTSSAKDAHTERLKTKQITQQADQAVSARTEAVLKCHGFLSFSFCTHKASPGREEKYRATFDLQAWPMHVPSTLP